MLAIPIGAGVAADFIKLSMLCTIVYFSLPSYSIVELASLYISTN
jgi:hypothetical protein